MIEFVLFVFAAAIFLYAFLAGADFGAGILQMLPIGIPRSERNDVIGKAIGPVWEANHIWLILALVIAFNGFPRLFWFVSEFYHFPLGAFVVGIIFRGASFTFMHYDPIYNERVQKFYHWIFGLSSLWCTFWMGIIVGSLIQGDFHVSEAGTLERYFLHWLAPFPMAMGVFMTLLMTFNASLFLYVEADGNKLAWQRVTLTILAFLIVMGMLSHGTLYLLDPQRWKTFFFNPLSFGAAALSLLLLFPQYILIKRRHRNSSRVLAGVQLAAIMAAGFLPQLPMIVVFRDGTGIDLYAAAAERPVMQALSWALFFGCVLILPGYFYLMKIFKSQGHKRFQDQ
jgi:cytochrome bd ubiquinol oxidase subunit II